MAYSLPVAQPISKLALVRARLHSIPAWGWLMVLAAGLRLVGLGSESLWYDETFTALLAKLDLPHMLAAVRGDVHPPLWYLIEWLNVRIFGGSEFAMRLPAALFSVLAVWLVWRLAVGLGFMPKTALLAGVLAAVLPASVYYGQEARMYSLLAVCVLVMANAALRRAWPLFAVGALGALYSQNLGVFYVASIGGVVLLSNLRNLRAIVRPVAALAVAGLGWLPWLSVVLKQAAAVKAGFWMTSLSPGAVLWPLADMTMGFRVPPVFQFHVYGIAVGISLIGLIACRKWFFSRGGAIYLALVFGAPLLIALVSVFWRSVYLHRALLPSTLGLCLLWAYPLQHMGKANRRVAYALVIPALVVGLLGHYTGVNGRPDVGQWTAPITDYWRAGDTIYYISIDACIEVLYYLDGLPYGLFPESTDLSQSLTPETKAAMGLNLMAFDRLADQGYKRAWLVVSYTALASRAELNEIDRIKANYPYLIASSTGSDTARTVIYLVELQK